MIFVLLPCYNESQNLPALVRELDEVLDDYQAVAVNDGSTDETRSVLEDLEVNYCVHILQHSVNLGLQAALLTGLDYILETASADDVLVTMDADGTQDPRDIPALVSHIKQGATVAIGSRYVDGGRQENVTLSRQIMSRGINTLLRVRTRIPVADQTSGFRAFDITALRVARKQFHPDFIEATGFAVSAELLVKTWYASERKYVEEVPILLDYGKKQGTSGLHLTETIADYLRLLGRVPHWQ